MKWITNKNLLYKKINKIKFKKKKKGTDRAMGKTRWWLGSSQLSGKPHFLFANFLTHYRKFFFFWSPGASELLLWAL